MLITKNDDTPRARVFISCGQRNAEEKQLGLDCLRYLESRGFECYFAEAVHNLEGLTENIFRHLRNAEYAVFIDCCRDKLPSGTSRGSLFVNQELAIAAFLGIDSRVFHQEGVAREGVAQYLIVNPIPFRDKDDFLARLEDATKGWHPDWRNELSVELGSVHKNITINNQPGQPLSDWYHLQVVNRHASKDARNCVAYVSKIRNIATGREIDSGNCELVWAGTGLFERHILPQRKEEIDAFYIVRSEKKIRFQHRPSTSTSPAYRMPVLEQGRYEITYLVVSENFDSVQKTFTLDFCGHFGNIKFREAPIAF